MFKVISLWFVFFVCFVFVSKVSSGKEYNVKQVECLIEAIYFEARSESFDGQLAVANVILNRVNNEKFPRTICGVVHHGHVNKRGIPVRGRCAFSYWCDGKPEHMVNTTAYRSAAEAATLALEGFVIKGLDRATYYHAYYVKPDWAVNKKFIRKLGTHLFYE